MNSNTSGSIAAMASAASIPQKLNPQQQQHMIQLLQASMRCVHSGIFHPVLYQTLGALHQYVAMQAGFSTTTSGGSSLLAPSRPAFYLVKNAKEEPKEEEKKTNKEGDENSDNQDDDEDVFAYGWVHLLSTFDDGPLDEPCWKPVLALLVQKDKDDEPCLWITQEKLTTDNSPPNDTKQWRPSTSLETLHSIPFWRRLQSCRYQNFYGDHRLILKLRHHHSPIVLRCHTAQDAQNWVQQIQWWKAHSGNKDNVNSDNIELEMIDTYDSQDHQKDHFVNVIVENDIHRGESMSSFPDSTSPDKGTQKRLAEQLQEAEDIKRAQKEAQELAEREQKLQLEEEKLQKQETESNSTAAKKDLTRVEREQAARKRAEEARRRKELEYEREKLEREKRRREELELQRQIAREEQKKKELLEKKKFLEAEEKKEKLKAQAAAAASKTIIVDSGVFGSSNKAAAKPAPVAARSLSSPTSNSDTNTDKPASNKAMTPPASKSNKGSDSLWFSLDQQMSAFEAADAERRKAEETKRKMEEEKRLKSEQERRARLGLDDSSEDPEEVRRRIAEQARQRLVQEDMAKHSPVVSTTAITMEETNQLDPPPQTQQVPTSGSIPPNSTSSHHASRPLPPQQHQHPQQPTNQQSYAQWQQQQKYHQQRTNGPYQQSGANHAGRHPSQQDPRYQAHAPHYHQNQYHNQHQSHAHPVNAPAQHPGQKDHQQQRWRNLQHPHPPPPSNANAKPASSTPPPQARHSAAHEKYAAMANQTDDGHASIARIKHAILIHWALQPPQLQLLRPIEVLITTIHNVFPPALGVPGHEYFTKWKPITASDISNEEQLNKTVRKVRFFLHPDKLPRDFSEEQHFTCKLLWDVTNDSYEDYKKGKEDLDWVK
jgi:hypothetical protein